MNLRMPTDLAIARSYADAWEALSASMDSYQCRPVGHLWNGPKRHWERWTKAEQAFFEKLLAKGMEDVEIARALARSVRSISDRRKALVTK